MNDIKSPYFDENTKRWIVKTTYKVFRFNIEENACKFVLLWTAGAK